MCSNVYDEAIDFDVSGFIKNTKLHILRTKHHSNKKNSLYTEDCNIAKISSLAEVTFRINKQELSKSTIQSWKVW